MDRNSIVASRIKEIRIRKNILQRHIASHLTISENAYSRIENGHTQITVEYLYLIADALDSKVEELLGLEKTSVAHNNSNVVISQFNEGSFNITLAPSDFAALKEMLESKK
jgi:transcriptional regulator with XRE-family HTH domain